MPLTSLKPKIWREKLAKCMIPRRARGRGGGYSVANMTRVKSGDAEIAYEVIGEGPPLVLLHAFPANHEMWLPAAQTLARNRRLVMPDLRAHGDSGAHMI